MQSKPYSISAFFPCYNDKGTIASLVLEVKKTLEEELKIDVLKIPKIVFEVCKYLKKFNSGNLQTNFLEIVDSRK